MDFRFSEEHIRDYHSLGFTVFHGVVPPSLVGELRRETDVGRERARENEQEQVHVKEKEWASEEEAGSAQEL